MKYDFDKPVDRRGTGDLKHEVLAEQYGRTDLLPLWVADMDWETPQFITDALKERMEHSLFGYTVEPKEYWPTVQRWVEEHHQWKVEREWMTYIPGIVSSWSVIPNEQLRTPFYEWLSVNELNAPNMFAPIATIAAFKHGEEWRQEMVKYVEGNVDFLIDYCQRYIPQIRPMRPQASYLVWLDCRGLGMNHEELNDFFVNRARIALNDGESFGPGGEGFMRLNVGTQRSVLKAALEQVRDAVNGQK